MSRKRTLYPSVNQAMYRALDTFDEFLNKAITNANITDPELSALRALHTQLLTTTAIVPRYKELR